jgi:4-amino-4-deoxy-L-arabinose transferase-like glycosyltransferase
VSKRLPLLLWLLSASLVPALIFAGPIERAQEARVLETAREMVGAGWKNWLIPHCNAQVRLRKPPLAYWAAAVSFKIFGVHDWAGRIPFALASWLTMGATYAAAQPIIGRRGALLASAALAGTYFFVRFGRYAETDVLAALFVTAAFAAFIHAALSPSRRRRFFLNVAAGVSIGLAVMSKGPPAVFPVLFLIGLAAILRRVRLLTDFLIAGLIPAAVVALPWWIFISRLSEFKVVGNEMEKVALGLDHPGPPWFYFLVSFVAIAPWCGFVLLGIAEAIRQARRNLRARILLLWIGCIIIPLSLVGKKQDHYMIPLLPPLVAVAGWAIELGLRGRDDTVRWNRIILALTGIACIATGFWPTFAAAKMRGRFSAFDFGLIFALLAAGIALMAIYKNAKDQMPPSKHMIGALSAGAILMLIAIGYWRPTLQPIDYPTVAARIHKDFGDRNLVLYEAENLPICFYLERTLPYYATGHELSAARERQPDLLVIWEQQQPSESPPPGKEVTRIHMHKRDIVLYEQ